VLPGFTTVTSLSSCQSLLGRIRCLVEPLRFRGSQDVTPTGWAGVGGSWCILDALGINPGSDLSHTGHCKLLPHSPPPAWRSGAGTTRSFCDRMGRPSVGSSLVRLSGSQGLTITAGTSWPAQGRQPAPAPHPNCQSLRLEPVLQRTSGTPALRSQIMGAHGDRLDFPRGRCTSSWTLLGPEGTWWTSVMWRSKPQLVVRSERPLLRIRLGGPVGTALLNSLILALRGAEPPFLRPALVIERPLRLRDLEDQRR